ncbi:MAG: transcriptional repressor NrdR [Planctomycetales bacterium]|nr:transcriptional repressor NrdR [Planctomycetales bacterium]
MKCPICKTDNDRVVDTRASGDGYAIRRRRECVTCGRRYTTYERIEQSAIRVVKKDGARVPLDREKIKLGLSRACWKRPVSDEQIEDIVTSIEAAIYERWDSEITSRELGEMVMRHLSELDQVAFVRFASVYREFNDVQDFVAELTPILREQQRSSASK